MRVRTVDRVAAQSIRLDIDFARVVDQTNDDTTYEISYMIDRPNILGAGIVNLELALIEKPESQKMNLFIPSLATQTVSPTALIDNILAKNATDLSLVAADKNVLMKTDVDFTSLISNDQTDRGVRKKATTRYVTVRSLDRSPVPDQHVPSTAPLRTPDKPPVSYAPQAHKLIMKGIDPTSVVVDNPTTQADLLNGTRQLTAADEKLALYSALATQSTIRRKRPKSAASDNAKVILREVLPARESQGKKLIKIANNILGTKIAFYIRIRLLGLRREIISEVTRRVEHARLVNTYLTPTIAPIVKAAKAKLSGRNVFYVTQRDPVATSVRVFRKVMFRGPTMGTYVPIGTFLATKRGGTIKVRDHIDNSTAVIYRVIPVGKNDIMGSVFTNAVATAVKRPFTDRRFSDDRANITITALHVQDGIQLRAHSFHDDVVAVQFMRKNISKRETQWTTVNNDLRRRAGHGGDASSTDTNMRPGCIFEYTARLTFRSGIVQIANAITTIQHAVLHKSQVQVKTVNPVVVQGDDVNIVFDIETNISDSMLSSAKRIIEQQGLNQFFAKELADERTLLNKLVVTRVERVDLDKGDVENMGIVIGTKFDDNVQARLTAAKPVRNAGRYRYVLYTYQRDPETVFDDYVKTSTARGRAYTFNPAKYKSPAALRRSTIVTRQTRNRTNIAESLILGDLVGITKIDVALQVDQPTIVSGVVNAVKQGNRVRWSTRGDISMIDHFIVFARRFETTEPIATIHTQSVKNAGTFVYNDVNGHDVDSYEIVAVYQDYETDTPFVVRQDRSA